MSAALVLKRSHVGEIVYLGGRDAVVFPVAGKYHHIDPAKLAAGKRRRRLAVLVIVLFFDRILKNIGIIEPGASDDGYFFVHGYIIYVGRY